MATPGVSGADEDDDEVDTDLTPEQIRAYRGSAARCNYLGLDRPDALYAIQQCSREMAKPTNGSWRRVTQIAKYFKKRPRLVWSFDQQPEPSEISVFTDSDWAGCKRSRKGTSGE